MNVVAEFWKRFCEERGMLVEAAQVLSQSEEYGITVDRHGRPASVYRVDPEGGLEVLWPARTVEGLFLGHSVVKLRQMAGYLDQCLSRLSSAQIWARDHDAENAIGNLILHLCGNLRQWIGSTLGGMPDIRVRSEEFAARGHDDLAGLLRETVSMAVATIAALPPARLLERVETKDGPRSVLEVVYQVVGHFQQHTGQVIAATKRATGEDLHLY